MFTARRIARLVLYHTYKRTHSSSTDSSTGGQLRIIVRDRKACEHGIPYTVGDNLLRCIQAYQKVSPQVYLEGACECSLACSTCHVILDSTFFTKTPEASEEEEDLLDQASCVTETSRLACQITLQEHHNGLSLELPKFSRNFYVDNHVPQPH
uniref:Adrenodoxin-like protein, mitochondrial n=1 Tax=Lygus hesperus TaxID=30085 RepID=A0A146LC80_LYGHE